MSITPLPPAPAITDTTSEFNTKAFNFVAALDTFVTETNATAEVCTDAEVTASAALAVVGAVAWVSGTTYAIGNPVYSPIDLQTYRRKTVGAGTTDPSLDAINWTIVSLDAQIATNQEAIDGTQTSIRSFSPSIIKQSSNTITAIATGSLSNGATVTVNENGTVSAYGSAVAQTIGTSAVFQFVATDLIQSVFDPINNRVVIAYRASGVGQCVVGTVSGTNITFGTPVIFNNANTSSMAITCNSINNRIVIAYTNVANSSFGTAIVGTVSGTSISFGTPVVFISASTSFMSIIFHTLTNRILICFQNAGTTGSAISGVVSGTSISFATAQNFSAGNVNHVSTVYDSFNNRAVVLYQDTGGSSFGIARVVQVNVNNGAVSFGTALTFRSTAISFINSCFDTLTNRIIAFYRVNLNANGEGITLSVDPTSDALTNAASVVFVSAGISNVQIGCDYDSYQNKAVVVYPNDLNSKFGTLRAVNVSSAGVITYDALVVVRSAETNFNSAVFDSITKKIIISYRDVGNSNFGTSLPFVNSGFNTSNFIGFSSGAYTNGQTAIIKTAGAIISNQIGLIAGKQYFVSSAGLLAFFTTSEFAGTAISATKLIVKG